MDLFSPSGISVFQVLGGEISLDESFLAKSEAEELYFQLLNETPWRQESVVIWGKSRPQPRLVSWYGDRAYTYSGLRLEPLPWTSALDGIRQRVEASVGGHFNSVLLNYYRDGYDRMGAHSDDEPELGVNPTIASVSLGAARRIRFIPKRKLAGERAFSLNLESGTLLVMKGALQRNWLHEIPKEVQARGRINLTFRMIRS